MSIHNSLDVGTLGPVHLFRIRRFVSLDALSDGDNVNSQPGVSWFITNELITNISKMSFAYRDIVLLILIVNRPFELVRYSNNHIGHRKPQLSISEKLILC